MRGTRSPQSVELITCVKFGGSKYQAQPLDREIFLTLGEAKAMLERFRIDYNTVRPHSALGYMAPIEAIEAAA